ncbi:Hypothetical protein SRAE_2000233000 [Strongyloides ratti]|uniref:Uncharacterized protein n=1 Tax=Strongyloides ratti TaxID=34506 RepID=A0A090MYS0_STRRB|nr:Hypothetical protein SRAE_2000233000 [Strongyloides ratti]CEF67669.1 Hypothetical protein SRAE_2000233000 [Strongyloides ratti]
MLTYRFFIKPLRVLIDPKYLSRPKGSEILTSYIRQRNYPSWTSYFIPYIYIQDDHFARKHFNFSVDGHNYHVLRVGAFPYIKYHCTKRPVENLTVEDNIYRIITVINLCIPCLLYGISAIFLIRHTDFVKDKKSGANIPIYFLIKEDHT